MAPGQVIILGIGLILVWTAINVAAVMKWRVADTMLPTSDFKSALKDILAKGRRHRWRNIWLIVNWLLVFFVVPPAILASICANDANAPDDTCAWSLVTSNATSIPTGGGAVGFGAAMLVLEGLLIVATSVWSLQFWDETEHLDLCIDAEYGHALQTGTPNKNLEWQWKWNRYTRVLVFITGVFQGLFGGIGRIIFLALAGEAGKTNMDTMTHGAVNCVIIFSIVNIISFMFLCCKVTWCESQLAHPDLAQYLCPVCQGSGRFLPNGGATAKPDWFGAKPPPPPPSSNSAAAAASSGSNPASPVVQQQQQVVIPPAAPEDVCERCAGSGVLWETQRLFMAPEIKDEKFPLSLANLKK
jgi:hypothetical protein